MTTAVEPENRARSTDEAALEILIIGATRYQPGLDPGIRKKFEGLTKLARFHVVSFGAGRRFLSFHEIADFHLAPHVSFALLRYLLLSLLTFKVGFGLLRRGRLHLILSEDPFLGLLGLALRFAARLRGTTVVLETEAHGDWEKAPGYYRRSLRVFQPVLRIWARFVLRRSDLIRTVSDELRQRIETIVPEGVPVRVFPAFTDLDLFLEAPPRPRDGEDLLFVGALSPVKGIPVLIEAFQALHRQRPESRLLLAGEGPLRAYVETEVRKRELLGSVSLLGTLSQVELRDRFDRARCLVLPSLSEGLPRVALEAMARRLPVVATQVGGLPELVQNGERGFLVEPGDVVALTERMLFLLENEDLALQMGNRGREFVEKNFSVKLYFDSYRDLFDAARTRIES